MIGEITGFVGVVDAEESAGLGEPDSGEADVSIRLGTGDAPEGGVCLGA